MTELVLRYNTPIEWTHKVLENFDRFLNDHAAAEKKASGMAMSMALHYKDKPELVMAMIDLAIEEMTHFRECVRLLQIQEQELLPDEKDPYVNQLRKHVAKSGEQTLLDRLLIGGIIEARGCERFNMVAEGLNEGAMKNFYQAISKSEAKHHELFVNLACQYFEKKQVDKRLNELLDIEADIVKNIPVTGLLH